MAPKEKPGAVAATGRGKTNYLKNIKIRLFRQLVSAALPYIACAITSTRFTARKSLFLDQLLVMAEGGVND